MADQHFAAFIRNPSIEDSQEDGDFVFIFNTEGKPHTNWKRHWKFYLIRISAATAAQKKQQLAQAANLATGVPAQGGKSRFAKATEDKVKARIASGLPPFRVKAGIVPTAARLRLAAAGDWVVVDDREYTWDEIAETH